MENELVTLVEYCKLTNTELSFIIQLEQSGLIYFTTIDDHKYIKHEQLMEVERFVHFHYDLDINIEGIEAIVNLLRKVKSMQKEIQTLKSHFQVISHTS